MPYKIFITIISIILGLIALNIIINIITTIALRALNPLRQLPFSKKLYLTFDDGIDRQYTPKLLKLLADYNIKATFFILADTLSGNTDILEDMQKSGHIIALHSYHHKNQIIQSPLSVYRDYKRGISEFSEYLGDPIYHRPTYGHISLFGYIYSRARGLKIILWNVIVKDWQRDVTPLDIKIRLSKYITRNSVICLHDGRGSAEAPLKTIAALKVMIPQWIKEGYSFEAIDTLY